MEIELNGHKYVTKKLETVAQWHVSRRLLPVLASFKDVISAIDGTPGDGGVVHLQLDVMIAAAGPLAEAVAKMSDADSDYIFNECFKCVSRAITVEGKITGWTPLWNPQAGSLQFADMNMMEMLKIVQFVIQESMGDFFRTAPSE